MIAKFRKLQETWFAKTILILTGLSFVSLFGVAGYMGSVGKNRPVIKVNNDELLQGEALGQLDTEIQTARKLFGDNFEITDAIRASMLQEIVQRNLNKMIIRNIAKENNISISDELVRKIIYSQPEFRGNDGKFDINRLRQVLSMSGSSEQQYIDSIKMDVIRQNVVNTAVENLNIPSVMLKYMAQINNQKRIFKYISIDTKNLPIDRKISEEEIQQYYQDFNLNFMAPETRDLSFIYLSNSDISNQMTISDEEAEAYYAENKDNFTTPETRHVLQMVFDDELLAQSALRDIQSGHDFYQVAQKQAKQEKEVTDLGYIAKDMLLENLAEPVFSLAKGQVSSPIATDMGWHIVKVVDIKAGSKTDKNKAIAQIKEQLKKEKMYDESYNLIAQIEDKIGAGEDLDAIADMLKAKIYTVKNLQEDGTAGSVDQAQKNIISQPDFIDMAFSYNSGEISQVVELEDGIALLRVDTIRDSHPKDIALVRPEIIKMWEANERTAIAQEIINDVQHDLEEGDSIDNIAKRFNLKLNVTDPLLRIQNFANLSEADMKDLFLEKSGTARIFNIDGKQIIALTDKIINTPVAVSSNDTVIRQTRLDLAQEYANRILSDFSSDYDVRIKYKLLGLAD